VPVDDGRYCGLWMIRKTEIRPGTDKIEYSRTERTETMIARSALARKLLADPRKAT